VLAPDAPDLPAEPGELRELLARLRAVVEAKDTEVTMLREQCRRLELEVAELKRRLGSDSTNSGILPSKGPGPGP
jgi:predicted  nucleic acid-binding Zn-ribbon protein